jgi:hypothetical protein
MVFFTKELKTHGRVRSSSSEAANARVDQRILKNITKYSGYTRDAITRRLEKLYKEWDVERLLEVNASILALSGIIMQRITRKRWYLLTTVVSGFLLQHGVQGWCPPLTIFRRIGIRTRTEINEEIYALKILRGDFDHLSGSSDPAEILRVLRT